MRVWKLATSPFLSRPRFFPDSDDLNAFYAIGALPIYVMGIKPNQGQLDQYAAAFANMAAGTEVTVNRMTMIVNIDFIS